MLKRSTPGLLGATIALLVDGGYIAVIVSEGNDPVVGVVLVFALLIGGAGLAAGIGSVRRQPHVRTALLWPATAILLAIGLLAVFSVGLPLLVAGGLTATAARGATSAKP